MIAAPTRQTAKNAEGAGKAARKTDVLAVAALLALVAAGVCLSALFSDEVPPPLRAEALNPFVLQFGGEVDTAAQRRGHMQALLMIAGLVLLAPLLRKLSESALMESSRPWIIRILGLAVAWFVFATFFWNGGRLPMLTVGLAGLPLVFLYRRGLTCAAASREFAFASVAVLALALLPGFFAPFDLTGHMLWTLEQVQAHYVMVVGQGDRLAAGQRLFEELIPYYSVLLTVVLGGWQLHVSPIDFGGYISLIRWAQVIYLIAFTLLYRKYAHGWKLTTLLAVAFLVPWFHFNQTGLSFPNHTTWRLLGQPAALCALFLVRRSSLAPASYVIGVASGVALLLNLETGVCITAALLAYLWFRYGLFKLSNVGSLPKAGALVALGIGSALSVFLLGTRLWLGYWPNLACLPVVWKSIAFVSSTGYSGMKGTFHPVAALFFGHAAYVLIATALRAQESLGFKQAFRAAVATAIIIWFAYYANRSEPWNLASYYGLYGFFLIDLLRMLVLRFRRDTSAIQHQVVAAAVIAFVVLPEMAYTFQSIFLPNYVMGVQVITEGPVNKPARLVSGVYLEENVARELEMKAAFIKQASKDRPAMYFTANSFFIPKLSGVLPPLPFADTFAEVITKNDYRKLLWIVREQSPAHIYFDAPGCKLIGPKGWQLYYAQLRKDLSAYYEKETETDGWEVWRRKS
ncbi:MAG TPA: hypothetical protein V6D08_07455 [Candidatus Obscuribacterales bacterium]